MNLLLCGLLLFSHAGFASVWTGRVQAIAAKPDSCSSPTEEIPQYSNIQIASQFAYVGCKEYRKPGTTEVFYRLERMVDGEYIRLLARNGESQVDREEYRRSSQSAIATCEQIRQAVIQHSVALEASSCAGQSLLDALVP